MMLRTEGISPLLYAWEWYWLYVLLRKWFGRENTWRK